MSKLNPEDLVVTSFETDTVDQGYDAGTNDPTPATRCRICFPTDNSCESVCLPQTE